MEKNEPIWMDDYLKHECQRSLENLAKRWAPIHYQYIQMDNKNNDFTIKTDLFCPVNFGSYGYGEYWEEKNNNVLSNNAWDTSQVEQRLKSAPFASLIPVAYYATAITDTHYFILYCFYHAWDSGHPNDLEGCLVILEKNSERPKLQGIITVAHLNFYPYYVVKKELDVKKKIASSKEFKAYFEREIDGDHVIIQQSHAKHALYGIGKSIGLPEKLSRWIRAIIGKYDNIAVFYPGVVLDQISKNNIIKFKNTPHFPQFYYNLIDIHDDKNGLYPKFMDAQRNNGNVTFTEKGQFHSKDYSLNVANGPWLWTSLIPQISAGEIWNKPANVVEKLFDIKINEFSKDYKKVMSEPEK